MQALRAFLNKEHSLLNSLKEIADPQGRFADRNQEATTSEREWTRSWDDSPEGIRWHAALQVSMCNILMASDGHSCSSCQQERSLLNCITPSRDIRAAYTAEVPFYNSYQTSCLTLCTELVLKQELDIVIAERRIAEALPLLKKAERTLMPGQKSGLQSHMLAGRSGT